MVAPLVSNRNGNMGLTCMLVHLPVGNQVEKLSQECEVIILTT